MQNSFRLGFPVLAIVVLSVGMLTSCRINPYDSSQEPKVKVGPGVTPTISWTPEYVADVIVLEGESAGNGGFGPPRMWSLSTGMENKIKSPVTYGVVPGYLGDYHNNVKPLEKGKTYTIWVRRMDPKGSGDGFTNTRNKYEGTITFTP